MKPLDGTVILDLSTAQSGRFCARMLGTFGARVYRPRGLDQQVPDLSDELRAFASTMAMADRIYLDAGKHRPQLELEGESLEDACLAADVIVETFRPGELQRRGVDPDTLIRAGKVVVSITPFGQDGPRAAWEASELTLQAYSGFLFLSGYPEREPVKAALEQMHLAAGRVATAAVLAALFTRSSGTRGDWLDVAAAEVAASLPPFHIQQFTHTGTVAGRGPRLEPALDGRHVRTSDGHICFATAGSAPFEMFSVLLDDERLLDDRFKSGGGRLLYRNELDAIVEPCVAQHSKYELFQRARELRIVTGVVQTVEDLLHCPHLGERGFFATLTIPDGVIRVPGLGLRAEAFGPPKLDADGAQADDWPARRGQASSPSLPPKAERRKPPLAGVRVVAVEDFFMLPWATVQLANLGAEVIHVEPRTGGRIRAMGVYPQNQPGEDFWNENSSYSSFERHKACVTMDLATPEGREVIRRLATTADVVMENNRPGAMERLGLGYEVLSADNPDLIMVRSSGYGQSGPYRDAGAFARTIDAMSGLTALTGYRNDEPLRANPSFMDMMGAWNNVCAALLGLLYRLRYHAGVVIDVSMYESGVSSVGSALVAGQLGLRWERQGNWHFSMAPQGVYPCLGDDRWLAITVRDDEDWKRLAQEIGLPWALDDRLRQVADRLSNRERLDEYLADWTREQDGFALEQRLQSLGLAAAVVRHARDLVLDEHLQARGFFQWVQTASVERDLVTPHPGLPFRFDSYRTGEVSVAPMGCDNVRVLRELGFDDDEIENLRKKDVIGEGPLERNDKRPQPVNFTLHKQLGMIVHVDEAYEDLLAALRKNRKR